MKYFILRNTTIENLFGNNDICYSGYDDILKVESEADVVIWFYLVPVRQNREQLVAEIETYFQKITLVYQQIPLKKMFLIFTLYEFFRIKYQQNDFSVEFAINEFNANVVDFARQHNNVKVIDLSDFGRSYSNEQLIDWKYFFLSKIQISPRLNKSFNYWFVKKTEAINQARKKCLILDLDNTLWDGILGEDGIDGIKVGGDYPGNAFSMFQLSLLELGKSGVILTICSKNNEKDVLEVWEKNPFLILKKEHFAAYRINWNNKADNIKELAEELNIGLDSLVFIDDNPSEREIVKQLLPMVEVPDFPEQPYLLPTFFEKIQKKYFDVYALTEEDVSKTEQYKANAKRLDIQKNFTDFSEYLASLEMVISIQKVNAFNILRIAQMTQKTNQFNLTTIRYNQEDIQRLVDDNEQIYCISVKDKFGDNGITGAMILKKVNEESLEIDSLLLSCRILGKGIEKAFIYQVLNLLKEQKIGRVLASYIPTSKNEQVKDFYEKIGFLLIDDIKGIKKYFIELQNCSFDLEPYYKIEIQ
jgi:FkbH-like protein